MIADKQDFDAFAANSAALHKDGLNRFGKRYKQHSNVALTTAFFALIEQLGVLNSIEIGAFQAEFSRRFMDSGKDRTAIAVEANPYNFTRYQEEISATGVVYHHAAVQDHEGTCTLQLSVTERDVQNGYIRGNNSIRPFPGRTETRAINVPGTTLDALVGEYVKSSVLTDPLLSAPVLWIDVEGALDLVIKGGHQTIRHSAAIFAEVETGEFWEGQSVFSEICEVLDELGFFPFLRDCEYEPDQFNVIFLNRKLTSDTWLQELSTNYTNDLYQLA